jgi:PAS domain S-box-containing protein
MRKVSVLRNKYNIPPVLIWVTLLLCVMPTFLNLCGVSFDLSNHLLDLDDRTILNELQSNKDLHPLLRGRFVHTMLVSFSISIAFLTVILAFVDYSIKRNVSTPIVGVALFCASMLDVVHILTSDQMIKLPSLNTDITSFTWLFSRTFHALILILGVGIFLIQKKESVREEYKGEKTFVAYISIIFVLLAINAILIVTDQQLKIPRMSYPDSIVKYPYDLLPLGVYLIAGIFIFPEFYRNNPSTFSQTLILSLIPAILTQVHMAFGSRELFDNQFNIAHYMKSVSYLVPFLGLSLNYVETHRNERMVIGQLDSEIREKEAVKRNLRAVLDSSKNGIMALKSLKNEKGEIYDFEWTMINPAGLYLTNMEGLDLIGKRFLDFVPKSQESGAFQRYVQVARSGITETFETQSTLSDRYFSVTVVKLSDGITVTFDDITQRRANEQKILKSEGLYRALAKNIPDSAVFLFDHDFNMTLVDGASLIDLGFSDKTELIGKSIDSILDKESLTVFKPLFEQVLKGEESQLDYSFRGKYFHINIIPVRNSENEIFSGMVVTHDITELTEYQKQLELKIEDLNRSNKELEQFAYVASHDLQEPLRKIRTFGDRLSSRYTELLGEDGKDYIARMDNAATRMQILIDDLLTFSRITRASEEFIPVNPGTIIQDVLNDMEVSIEHTGAQIRIGEFPDIDASPAQMRQLFQNLISNAIRFRKKDVPPIIYIHGEIHSGKGNRQLDRRSNYLSIQVQDNGIGFDEKYSERIYVIFQRLHGRTEYEGTGIGLAICKKIVESHHGLITAESSPGNGATFTVTLPVNQKKSKGKV